MTEAVAERDRPADGATQVRPRTPSAAPPPAGRRKRAAAEQRSRAERRESGKAVRDERHLAELIALACFGLAVFLAYVLATGGGGGLLGRVADDVLRTCFGLLAYFIPAALLAVAGCILLQYSPRWVSAWLLGGVLLLFSLFLLVESGFPPVGPAHGLQTFVPAVYLARAGWVGEVWYVGVLRLTGSVGVALIGWLGLIAGISLVTGLTVRRVLEHTGRAAVAVRAGAEEHTRRRRDRAGEPERPGPLDDPYLQGFGAGTEAEPTRVRPGRHGPSGGGDPEAWPDDGLWVGSDEPTWVAGAPADSRPLIDGAAAFPDLYHGDDPRGAGGGRVPDASPMGKSTGGGADSVAAAAMSPEGGRVGDGEPTLVARRPASEEGPGIPEAGQLAMLAADNGVAPYLLPNADLLKKSAVLEQGDGRGDRETADLLVATLADFGVDARVVGMVVGPRVTRYELQLAPGTKVSKVAGLKDDLAYALASTEIRILAPIPGKQAVGVEVPNRRPSFVTLGDIFRDFPKTAGPLMVWLGKDISGKPVYADLAKMPHLLIAGTTGSGKSGCVNCIISSILLRATPTQVKMILIDPKKVELSHYERIPHLLVPVVTNMKNAAGVLANVVKEMDNRYELMELERSRQLDEMNQRRAKRGESPLPYVIVVIDELADLMMVAPADVEEYIIRLAQKARAVGIHLVVATQRPSVDVITGMIKANIPSRIAFAVSSQTDSRVILDSNGAETLLGMGDMLFRPLGSNRLQRVQGAFITEEEIARLVAHTRRQAQPEFREELLAPPTVEHDDELFDPDEDDLLADAAELVLETGSASVSMLQRRLRVGYTRAGRLIDMLERRGIVGPYEGSKPRQIKVKPEDFERVMEGLRSDAEFSSDLESE